MNVDELYKNGQLQEAIDAQIQEVKSNPADQRKRIFLFELLSFAGEWDRAKRQIEAVQYEELEMLNAVQQYSKLLESEEKRRRLFSESLKPRFVSEPPDHVHWRIDAINFMRDNNYAEAAKLLAKANQSVPPIKGILNGKPFENLHDTDDLFGTVLEVMAHGQYYWVPMEHLDGMAKNEPQYPRDLIWIPTKLEMQDMSGDVFLPALYPGTSEHENVQVKLGRMTVDTEYENGALVMYKGLRNFAVGDQPKNIFEIADLQITT